MKNLIFILVSMIAVLGFIITFGITADIQKTTMNKNKQTFTFQPIGYFHSPLTPKTGAPRQGRLAESPIKGKIEMINEYEECLEGIQDFSHIYVLFVFDRSTNWTPKVTPPHATQSRGLFATRSPNRPNPIGITVLELEKREGRFLHVSGLDAFDQTPILDIKPYIGSIDAYPDASQGIEKELGITP